MNKSFIVGLTLLGFVGIVLAASTWVVTLSWAPNPPSDMVTQYVVWRAPGNSTNYVPYVTVTTNYAVFNESTGAKYKIQAVNGQTNSALSDYVMAPTNAPATPATPVVNSITTLMTK